MTSMTASYLLQSPFAGGPVACAALALVAALACPSVAMAAPQPGLVASLTFSSPSLDRARAIDCLATAIAYEAGHEPEAGQQAVGEVILNRTRHPAYPKSVCGVVFEGSARRTGCQFTFTCDGSLARRLPAAVLATSRRVAESVLDGSAPAQIGDATHYHADYVRPYWAPSLVRVSKIGAHIFYRMPGTTPPAGTGRDGEPEIAALAGASGAGRAAAPRPAAAAPAVFAPWGLRPVRTGVRTSS